MTKGPPAVGRGRSTHRLKRLAKRTLRDIKDARIFLSNWLRPGSLRHGLVVLDDVFPHPLSPFRIAEYGRYLERWDDSAVYSTAGAFHVFDESRDFNAVRRDYGKRHPQLAARVFEYHKHRHIRCQLAYTVFIANAHYFISYLERRGLPLVFTLYPGGSFAIDDPDTDRMLRRVCSSPSFRKVICTQQITLDYLLEHDFCSPEQTELIYGGVFATSQLIENTPPRTHYKLDKPTLDICFVAMKYMPAGRDKGYDTFVEVARRLSRKHEDVRFHVVGPFDESDVDVTGVASPPRFYGPRPTEFFPTFYSQMDIILSPNVPFVLAPGAFDGFPTGCCIEAGICGTAVVCTDVLGLNTAFEDGTEIVVIPPDPTSICERIDELRSDPEGLRRLTQSGQAAFRRVFDIEAQFAPRLRIIDSYIDSKAVEA